MSKVSKQINLSGKQSITDLGWSSITEMQLTRVFFLTRIVVYLVVLPFLSLWFARATYVDVSKPAYSPCFNTFLFFTDY